jgi:hypothetical protein
LTAVVPTPHSTPFIQLQETLKASHSWTSPSSSSISSSASTTSTSTLQRSSSSSSSYHPMYVYLKNHTDKEKGWLRRLLPFKDKKATQQKMSVLLTIMTALFSGFNCNGGVHHSWNSMLCNAWDINWKTTIRKFNTFIEHGFSVEQKVRLDKGSSVFTCDNKRRHVFTAFNVYK